MRASSISRESDEPQRERLRRLVGEWRPSLLHLAQKLRSTARASLVAAVRESRLSSYAKPIGRGAGDLTFGLDRACEDAIEAWFEECAQRAPLSLLTEDRGWRHRGPHPTRPGGTRELSDFDHGGVRIAIDPVDGTRHLMADLRSAWSVIGWCPPGPELPRMSDVHVGLVSEIPDTRSAYARVLWSEKGAGARHSLVELATGEVCEEAALVTDIVDQVDHGYFPFFAYHPRIRPHIARLAAKFFERIAEHEAAALESCYDDQYISSGGQLALLALGTYRAVVELRHHVARSCEPPTQVAKAYDVTGAVLCAREAGCVLTDPAGGELDFPIDATSPIDFVAWANSATAERLAPHLAAVLQSEGKATR